jgi:hypothetical protein
MKQYMAVLFAGAMLASAGFAATSDPFAAERFRLKTGRDFAAEAARGPALVQDGEAGAMACAKKGCCTGTPSAAHRELRSAESARAEQVFKAKWGRNTPAEEARQEAAKGSEMRGIQANDTKLPAEKGPSIAETWMLAKLGRSAPADAAGALRRLAAGKPAATVVMPCACCD